MCFMFSQLLSEISFADEYWNSNKHAYRFSGIVAVLARFQPKFHVSAHVNNSLISWKTARRLRRCQTNIQTDTKTSWTNRRTQSLEWQRRQNIRTVSSITRVLPVVVCDSSSRTSVIRHVNNFSAHYHYRFVSTNTSLSPPVPPKKVHSRNELSSLGRSIITKSGYVGRPSWKLHTKQLSGKNGSDRSASCSGRFWPGQRAPNTYRTRNFLGPRPCVDVMVTNPKSKPPPRVLEYPRPTHCKASYCATTAYTNS